MGVINTYAKDMLKEYLES